MTDRTDAGNGAGSRGVIVAAFDLLDRVGVMEPVRLVDLAEATGIPQPTVYRLLRQLIDVGAVRREGLRYRLGESLLGLGSRVTPERRLRVAARRPLAELAAVTGAAVALTAAIGSEPVFLATIDARVPLGIRSRPGQRGAAGDRSSACARRDRATVPDGRRRRTRCGPQLRRGEPSAALRAGGRGLHAGRRDAPACGADNGHPKYRGANRRAVARAVGWRTDAFRKEFTQRKIGRPVTDSSLASRP